MTQGPTNHAATDDTPLFLAGHTAPSGTYHLVGTDQEVHLDREDVLPATCDGHVAVYVRQPTTWAEMHDREMESDF